MRWMRIAALSVAAACLCGTAAAEDRERGLAAWREMESVLASPRCLNCHTGTDFPRQGDDRHRHRFQVIRGEHGTGAEAMRCAACHHDANFDTAGVPGAPGWRMPPESMSWERSPGVRKTSRELCRLLKDRERNGGRSAGQLVEHHAEEPLVQWAWSPGRRADGEPRTPPPLSREQFLKATRTWAAAGTPCP